MMNTILIEFLDRRVVIYIDDILIYSKDLKEYGYLISAVFDRLLKEVLAAEPEKCDFGVAGVHFLGYVISTKGVEI